jgi:hypothetical protein
MKTDEIIYYFPLRVEFSLAVYGSDFTRTDNKSLRKSSPSNVTRMCKNYMPLHVYVTLMQAVLEIPALKCRPFVFNLFFYEATHFLENPRKIFTQHVLVVLRTHKGVFMKP